MTSTFTTNKYIEKPGNNDYINNWNVPLNSDMDVLDAALGSAFAVSTINTDVYLTILEARNQRIVIQGALTANVSILIPFVSGSVTTAIGGMWIVDNQTTGAFTVTVKTVVAGSTGVTVGANNRAIVYSDGTNCKYAEDARVVFPQDLATSSTTAQFASLGVGVAPTGVSGQLKTAGQIISGGAIGVTGTITASGAITTASNLSVTGTSAVTGAATFGSTVTATGALVTNGNFNAGGNIVAGGNVTAFSDERLKENIKPIENALVRVSNLVGVQYTRKDSGEQQIGLIAQDVQKEFPEVVMQGDEYLSVAYGNLVSALIEAIKELNQKVGALEAAVHGKAQ